MIMAVLFANCLINWTVAVNEISQTRSVLIPSDDFHSLVNKARWGDGKAFLQLANCYRDGIGVKKDFVRMITMVFQAVNTGGIENAATYIKSMPDDNEYRVMFELETNRNLEIREKNDSIIAKLLGLKSLEAQTLCGIISIDAGDVTTGMNLIKASAEQGFVYAEMLLALYDMKSPLNKDTGKTKLIQLTDKIPIANKMLGDMYMKSEGTKKQAAYYFMRAEEYALLNKRETDWLLSYFNNGGDIKLTDEDVKRLECLAKNSCSQFK